MFLDLTFPLQETIKFSVTDFSEYDKNIPTEECSYLSFQKTLDLDYFEDWNQLLKDRAIAQYLQEWETSYDP